MIDETTVAPGELQELLRRAGATVPELELIGAHTVQASWSEDDYELYRLTPYELLLCRVVCSQLQIPILGFETGEWPGGLRFDEIPGWKRRIWASFRKGQMDRHADDHRDLAPRLPSVDSRSASAGRYRNDG